MARRVGLILPAPVLIESAPVSTGFVFTYRIADGDVPPGWEVEESNRVVNIPPGVYHVRAEHDLPSQMQLRLRSQTSGTPSLEPGNGYLRSWESVVDLPHGGYTFWQGNVSQSDLDGGYKCRIFLNPISII